jgi:hypothetical protein
MVGNQIDTLILNPCFSHSLCCKCSNESCERIFDIYVLRDFQWYNELFNPMNFDPLNHSLKIQESKRALTPKVGIHLGVHGLSPSHSLAFPTYTFPCPCLDCEPKAKIVISFVKF